MSGVLTVLSLQLNEYSFEHKLLKILFSYVWQPQRVWIKMQLFVLLKSKNEVESSDLIP